MREFINFIHGAVNNGTLDIVVSMTVIVINSIWSVSAVRRAISRKNQKYISAFSASINLILIVEIIKQFIWYTTLVPIFCVSTLLWIAVDAFLILIINEGYKYKYPKLPKSMFFWLFLLLVYCVLSVVHYSFIYKLNHTSFVLVLVILVCESIIRSDLTDTNEHFDEILKSSGVPLKIADSEYRIVYKSDCVRDDYAPLAAISVSEPYRIDGNTLVYSREITNGYALMQSDIFELSSMRKSLRETERKLKSYHELIDKEGEISEKLVSLKIKNKLYSNALKTVPQKIAVLHSLLYAVTNSGDEISSDSKSFKMMKMIEAHIKAYYDLIRYAGENGSISALKLSDYICDCADGDRFGGIKHEINSKIFSPVKPLTAAALLLWLQFICETAVTLGDSEVITELFENDKSVIAEVRIAESRFRHKFEAFGTLRDIINECGGNITQENYTSCVSFSLSFPKGGGLI